MAQVLDSEGYEKESRECSKNCLDSTRAAGADQPVKGRMARVETRTVDGVTRNYRIDPTTGATLSEESGGTTTRYSYDDSGGLMSSSDSSQVLYYHFGTDGNVYALTTGGSSPEVAGSASYDLQGNSVFNSGSMGGQPYQSGGMGGDYTISGDGGLQLVQVGGETESTSSGESYDVVGEWVMYDQHIPPSEGAFHTMPFFWPVLFRMLSDADRCREPIDWSSMVIGFGDGLTFGATRPIRRAILEWGWGDTEDVADTDSPYYKGAFWAGAGTTATVVGGYAVQGARSLIAAYRAAQAAPQTIMLGRLADIQYALTQGAGWGRMWLQPWTMTANRLYI